MSRTTVAALVTGLLVAYGAVRLRSSVARLDERVAGSHQWESGTWAWGYRSPKVEALGAVLARVRAAIPARSVVAVEGDRFADNEEFLVHWAQFLAPELVIVLRRDLPAEREPDFVLQLGRSAKGDAPGEIVLVDPIGRLCRPR